MTSRPLATWLLLAVWATWLSALQGIWASASPWAPDLGVALLVVLASRAGRSELPAVGLAIGLGRIAVSVDPPAAVLAGLLGVTLVVSALRGVLEVGGALPRAALAGASAALFAAWLGFVHDFRTADLLRVQTLELHTPAAGWPSALTTAVATLVLAPVLAHLPGLSPLSRRTKWQVVASGR
jgi:hypothetical protein